MGFTSYIKNHKKKILKWILIGLAGWGVLYGLLILLIALNWSHGDPYPERIPFKKGDTIYLDREMPTTLQKKTFIAPSFPGGRQALDSFITAHTDTLTKIPLSRWEESVRENVWGPLYVKVYLIIDSTGNIDHYKYPVPDDEAIGMDLYDYNIRDIIRAMPKWSPAYHVDTITGVRMPIEYVGLIRVKYELDMYK